MDKKEPFSKQESVSTSLILAFMFLCLAAWKSFFIYFFIFFIFYPTFLVVKKIAEICIVKPLKKLFK
jgi:hypothetical protein